nr:phosphoribosyl-AMP cyclohydrolase [Croceibacterium salegens]
MPKYDAAGLVSAVVQHAESGEVLMVAFMDAEALVATRKTGLAHFHSRSRGRLWMKGESSGHVLRVQQVLVDCDQDALVLKALPEGPTCHTGARSCFYRALDGDGLAPLGDD